MYKCTANEESTDIEMKEIRDFGRFFFFLSIIISVFVLCKVIRTTGSLCWWPFYKRWPKSRADGQCNLYEMLIKSWERFNFCGLLVELNLLARFAVTARPYSLLKWRNLISGPRSIVRGTDWIGGCTL